MRLSEGIVHSETSIFEGLFGVFDDSLPEKKQLLTLGDTFGVDHSKEIIEEVTDAVSRWKDYANDAGVSTTSEKMITEALSKIY